MEVSIAAAKCLCCRQGRGGASTTHDIAIAVVLELWKWQSRVQNRNYLRRSNYFWLLRVRIKFLTLIDLV